LSQLGTENETTGSRDRADKGIERLCKETS
jgi:hypothetical protein